MRSNPVVSDPRVEKEVNSLTANGLKVTVLAWDREGRFSKFDCSNGKIIHRMRLSVPYRKLVVVAYYPIYWFWEFKKLLQIKPRVVHVCDLDSFFPAFFYRFFNRKTKVIFDVFDTASLLAEAKSALLGKFVRLIELQAAARADAFVTVSNERLHFFRAVKLKLTEVILNCPPDLRSSSDHKTYAQSNAFRIVYAGVVAEHRGPIEVAEAIKDMSDVEFIVAGRVLDATVIDRLHRYPSVKYIGQLQFNEALALQGSADVIPVLYDLRMPLHKSPAPNKLFEAMMLGVPIITNVSNVLSEVNCGIKVDYNDVAEIERAIINLKKHPELRRQLGANGRLAFEQKYNWSVMEEKLVNLYNRVLNNQNNFKI